MALTTGKKTTVVTPSSVANRMGIVDAYGGDWVATAADAIGNTLDEFTKRAVVQEEEAWKAKFSIDTFKSIKGFANNNRVNPSGFYNSVDPYVEQLIEKVPARFKGWAKQYAGMMAAREGQDIHLRHYNKKQADLIKLNIEDTNLFVQNSLERLEKLDISQWDDEMVKGLVAELAEKTVSYSNIYSTLDPQYSSNLDLPEVWAKNKILGFEQSRVNTRIKSMLKGAIILDQESVLRKDINGDGNIAEPIGAEHDALSYLEQAEKEVVKYLKNYRTNPDDGDLDGFSTLLASENDEEFSFMSTDAERVNIINNSIAYKDTLIAEQARLQQQIDNQNATNHTIAVNQLKERLEVPYLLPNSEQELINIFESLNIQADQRLELTNKYHTMDTISKYAEMILHDPDKQKRFQYKGKYFDLPDQSNVWGDALQRAKGELKNKWGITDVDDKEIMRLIVDKHMFQITGKRPDELDFQFSSILNETSDDLDHIKNYVSRWGIVPREFSDWLGNWDNLNYDVEGDREQLIEMAQSYNYIRTANLTKGIAIEGIEANDGLMLEAFYNDWKKRKDIIDRTGKVPEDEKITEQEFVQRWWKARDKKVDEIDLINQEINNLFTRFEDKEEGYFETALKEAIDKTRLDIFGASYGSMTLGIGDAKVKPLVTMPILGKIFGWLKVTDKEAVDLNLNLAATELQKLLPDIMTDYYISLDLNERDLATRPSWLVEDDVKHIIKWAIRDLSSQGWDSDD